MGAAQPPGWLHVESLCKPSMDFLSVEELHFCHIIQEGGIYSARSTKRLGQLGMHFAWLGRAFLAAKLRRDA